MMKYFIFSVSLVCFLSGGLALAGQENGEDGLSYWDKKIVKHEMACTAASMPEQKIEVPYDQIQEIAKSKITYKQLKNAIGYLFLRNSTACVYPFYKEIYFEIGMAKEEKKRNNDDVSKLDEEQEHLMEKMAREKRYRPNFYALPQDVRDRLEKIFGEEVFNPDIAYDSIKGYDPQKKNAGVAKKENTPSEKNTTPKKSI